MLCVWGVICSNNTCDLNCVLSLIHILYLVFYSSSLSLSITFSSFTSLSSTGAALKQLSPLQNEQVSVQNNPLLLHPHADPQPVLQEQNIIFRTLSGAAGWVILMGIK